MDCLRLKIFLLTSAPLLVVLLSQQNSFAQWGADVNLTNNPSISKVVYNFAQCVASDASGRVHVVYYDDSTGVEQVYYKRSLDNGATWGEASAISPTSAMQHLPVVAASGQNVYLAWHDFRLGNFDIFFKRSFNGGTTWDTDVQITTNPNNSQNPAIAISGSNIYLVWTDARDGNNEIYFSMSTNSGSTWTAEKRISTLPYNSWTPTIAASGSNVHVFWVDTQNGNEEEYYSRSTNNGSTFSSPVRLTFSAAASWAPSAYASGNTVHLVFFDQRSFYWDVYYKKSNNNGATWGADVALTDNASFGSGTFGSTRPTISGSGSDLHVVWNDYRDGSGSEVYYRKSSNNGNSWGTTTRLTTATGESQHAHIIDSPGYLHLVWWEQRDLNDEVYYKRYVK